MKNHTVLMFGLLIGTMFSAYIVASEDNHHDQFYTSTYAMLTAHIRTSSTPKEIMRTTSTQKDELHHKDASWIKNYPAPTHAISTLATTTKRSRSCSFSLRDEKQFQRYNFTDDTSSEQSIDETNFTDSSRSGSFISGCSLSSRHSLDNDFIYE